MANTGIWTSLFWKDTIERTISTVAQVLITILSVDGLDLVNFDLEAGAIAVGIAGALTILKAVAANAITDPANTVSPASLAGTSTPGGV
jgi:hypothetical protein